MIPTMGVKRVGSPKKVSPSQSKQKRPNNIVRGKRDDPHGPSLKWDWGPLKELEIKNEPGSSNVAHNSADIIKISSSEEESPSPKKPRSSESTELRTLKAEKAALKQRYQELQNRFRVLEDTHSKTEADLKKWGIPAVSQIIRCEICLAYMNTPTFIVECGHTFCHGCIHRWFTEEDRKDVSWSLDLEPGYSCPLCRGKVTSRPCPAYKFNEIVSATMQEILKNLNLQEAEKIEAENHRHAVAQNEEQWDQYFFL
ncbi:hypothetical protein E1B28_005112 [Marasmius oreades]|uniref:RING-type domain-containing protein n=1 Tax=Marasmius oreades TaxID=181124 RepID=A0A9P7V014_9AGAR|nr:uncharacterized protein E1B28_005112 [Marasmius oreades]KAG7097793.1 hypothetical protein E1B28_005112 [Marasmius oreades]